jgi:hypothetical protein
LSTSYAVKFCLGACLWLDVLPTMAMGDPYAGKGMTK